MAQISQKGCALITGAGGRLGRLLRAARDDSPGLIHDFLFQSRSNGADVLWRPGHPTDVLPACDAIIALWGATAGDDAQLALNETLVTLGSDLARDLGARRVVHLSSAAVYGPGQNMHEDHATGDCNRYGKSKLRMEAAVDQERQRGDLTHLCLRLANVVGADSLAPALRGERPTRIDDFDPAPGSHQGPVRSYIGAKGLITILDALLSLPADRWPPVLNIAAPNPIPMEALARAAGQRVIWQPAPETAVAEVSLDVSRLQALLPGIDARMTAEDAAADLIAEWLRLESRA